MFYHQFFGCVACTYAGFGNSDVSISVSLSLSLVTQGQAISETRVPDLHTAGTVGAEVGLPYNAIGHPIG